MMRFAIAAAVLVSAGVASAQTAPQTAAPQTAAPQGTAPAAALTIDSPIYQLVANPASKAVLEKHVPGISTHARYEEFKDMSLPALAPMSRGRVTAEMVAAVEADLKALPAK